MKVTDYRSLIDKYFKGNETGKSLYLIHVTLVTQKALSIARKLNLDEESLRFIEEASMLHDIGCVCVEFPEMGSKGTLPYLRHMTEGHRILEEEGLPKHARVASTHTGVGIDVEQIRKRNLPLPERDFIPKSLEERIISYADLFYSKNPKSLFKEKMPEHVRESLGNFGEEHQKIFDQWQKEFEG